jgi:TolA-binding protein
MPKVDIGEDKPAEYGNEDFGEYDYEGWDLDGEDEDPSLTLPPGFPSDALTGDLTEPFLENGEAFLPDSPPEAAAIALAEPLPEPEPPDMPEPEPPPPVLAEEPAPEELLPEDSSAEALLPEEPAPEELPAEEPPPAPVIPPPPRIVRPSEPIPPPPPAREIIPMPSVPLPDPPARNPQVLPDALSGSSLRTARALAGQTVEIPFRGTGWVYLGESASKGGLNYVSRRLDGEGQTFVFRAAEAGVYELKFYRQDFIRDYIMNDLVTVVVEEPPAEWSAPTPRTGAIAEQGTVTAEPRWPAIPGRTTPETGAAPPQTPARSGPAAADSVPSSGSKPDTAGSVPSFGSRPDPAGSALPSGSRPVGTAAPETAVPGGDPEAADGAAMPGETASGTAEPSLVLPQNTMAEEYLRRAREEYQEERFPQSMVILDQFLERFPLGSDEAYWLYAQLCEKQGPSRDIRLALDYYRRLLAEYPQSGRCPDARRRIAYLERYYINIQ